MFIQLVELVAGYFTPFMRRLQAPAAATEVVRNLQ